MCSHDSFKLTLFLGIQLLLWSTAANADQSAPSIRIEGEVAIDFETQSGATVNAFQGQFQVSSNWQNASSDSLTLSYVRFPQTGQEPGAPIIYLAGGPGGSGSATARSRRFPLFMAMREFGDVIAFDQRGTGESSRPPGCTSSQIVVDTTRYDDQEFAAVYRAAAEECLEQWAGQGVRPQDWTTRQSVGDLEALRQHLGADRISLWGISYGSHLALAALKTMDDRIARVVLASVEGLNQTVKWPSETDAYFERLQAAINARPELRQRYPDIVGLMRGVHASLDAEPITIPITPREGEAWELLLQTRDLQRLASMMIADPAYALRLIDLYGALAAGVTAPLSGLLGSVLAPNDPVGFAAMPFFMDIASGIGAEELIRFEAEARSALVGSQLNFPMPQLHGVVDDLDLGENFRRAPVSDVPALILIGTLDGRTYPDSQRAAVAGLKNAEITLIENAGHNLFMASPAVTERIQAFMRGQPGSPSIRVDDWVP